MPQILPQLSRESPAEADPGETLRRSYSVHQGLLRKERRGAVSGAVGRLAGSMLVDVDAAERFGREWAVEEASLCMGMWSVGVGRRQAGEPSVLRRS